MKHLLIAAASLTIAMTAAVPEAQAQRRLDSYGAGNCIFSKQPLGYGKEGTTPYRNANPVFDGADDVYGRCYIDGTYNSHKKHGLAFSSMRQGGHYYAIVKWIRPADQNAGEGSVTIRRLRHPLSETGSWNQQAYFFTKTNDCDLSVEGMFRQKFAALPNGCIHFGRLAKKMAQKYNIALPYTAKFCMEQAVLIANKHVSKYDNGRYITQPDKFYRKLSGGCFNVRVNG